MNKDNFIYQTKVETRKRFERTLGLLQRQRSNLDNLINHYDFMIQAMLNDEVFDLYDIRVNDVLILTDDALACMSENNETDSDDFALSCIWKVGAVVYFNHAQSDRKFAIRNQENEPGSTVAGGIPIELLESMKPGGIQ